MEQTLVKFVRALRNANVRVSPAETLVALTVFHHIGISDRQFLKEALALCLAKTAVEKQIFEVTFERFFGQLGFRNAPHNTMLSTLAPLHLSQEVTQLLDESLVIGIRQLLDGRRELLTEMLQRTAIDQGIEAISSLREKRTIELQISNALGLPKIDTYLDSDPDADDAPLLRYVRQYLHNQVHDYVDRQYAIHVDPSSKRAIVEAALASHLNNLPLKYYGEVQQVVKRLAQYFSKVHRKRSKRARHGQLEYKRTIRQNMAYGGNVFELRWRRVRKEVSTVYVICDVSNSVAPIARFLLLFLYELVDVLPRIRAFAFSSNLGEVTETFLAKTTNTAIEEALFDWGKGNTDYGRAFLDFRASCGRELNKRSTVIVLGDARSNFYDVNIGVFAELAKRTRQLFWLSPETRAQWREGDSEMARFAPFCTEVMLCNRIDHIKRFADRLLREIAS